MRLRLTKNRQEILVILKEALIKNRNVTLWQKINGKKKIFRTLIVKLAPNFLFLRFPLNEASIDYNSPFSLYYHGEFRNILFKAKKVRLSNEGLKMAIPEEIRLDELRDFQRVYFTREEQKFIEFTIPSLSHLIEQVFNSTLMNISQDGAGFLAKKSELLNFNIGSRIFIKGISQVESPEDLIGEVIHHNLFKGRSIREGAIYTIGIRFNKKVSFPLSFPRPDNPEIYTIDRKRKGNKTETRELFLGLSLENQKKYFKDLGKLNPNLAREIRLNNKSLSRVLNLPLELRYHFFAHNERKIMARAFKTATIPFILKFVDGINDKFKLEFLHHLRGPQTPEGIVLAQIQLIGFITRQKAYKIYNI